jgi:2-haloacid dehalogenase
MSLERPPKAVLFDVFGTVVDWESSITNTLVERSKKSLDSSTGIPPEVKDKASEFTTSDWKSFAKKWRAGYGEFTRGFNRENDVFITIDEFHHNSLKDLLKDYGLEGLWSEDEVKDISLAWHRLTPWPDSSEGIAQLNKKFETGTLSNGNIALLESLSKNGPLAFKHIFSAEHFKAYKPSPLVYNGVAEKLGLETKDCALVATHLFDLAAAKHLGYQTIYVERPGAESPSADTVDQARRNGWVDMWIDHGEGNQGILEVAKRFGIDG